MILAMVYVYRCDRCTVIVSADMLKEDNIIETKWHEGLANHYCFHCKSSEIAMKNIELELETVRNFGPPNNAIQENL